MLNIYQYINLFEKRKRSFCISKTLVMKIGEERIEFDRKQQHMVKKDMKITKDLN